MKSQIADPEAAANTGSYSPALRIGPWVYVSGQGPIDPAGNVIAGDIVAETRLTMHNVARLLKAAGAGMDDVVKCTVYLADLAEFKAFDAEYRSHFADPLPARTTVQAGLQGIRVEIDAVAYAEAPP
jgi:2-iminobutanoate/2-iminopropanoate deaminase